MPGFGFFWLVPAGLSDVRRHPATGVSRDVTLMDRW